jgi:hypothetical protein
VERGFIDSILAACAAISGQPTLRHDLRTGTEHREGFATAASSLCRPEQPPQPQELRCEVARMQHGDGHGSTESRDARSSPSAHFLSAREARALYHHPAPAPWEAEAAGEEEEEAELVAASLVRPPPRKVLRASPRSVSQVALGDLSFDEAFE